MYLPTRYRCKSYGIRIFTTLVGRSIDQIFIRRPRQIVSGASRAVPISLEFYSQPGSTLRQNDRLHKTTLPIPSPLDICMSGSPPSSPITLTGFFFFLTGVGDDTTDPGLFPFLFRIFLYSCSACCSGKIPYSTHLHRCRTDRTRVRPMQQKGQPGDKPTCSSRSRHRHYCYSPLLRHVTVRSLSKERFVEHSVSEPRRRRRKLLAGLQVRHDERLCCNKEVGEVESGDHVDRHPAINPQSEARYSNCNSNLYPMTKLTVR
jgi:hypothetical protein